MTNRGNRAKLGCCTPTSLLALAAILVLSFASGLYPQQLYWTALEEYPKHAIRKSNADGSELKDIVTGLEAGLSGLTFDPVSRLLYWVENGDPVHQIVQADLDGKQQKIVLKTDQFLSRIVVDPAGGVIYFTASTPAAGAGIRRSILGSGESKLVIEAEADDLALDAASGKIYWVEEGEPGTWGTDIWRASIDGTGKEPVAHHAFEHHTTGIAVDSAGGKLYWATVDYRVTHAQLVDRANLDGTDIEPVTTANPGLDDWPVHLDIDFFNRKLYWVNGEDGVFFRVALDGGEAERLYEEPGPFGPLDLVLVQPGDSVPPSFRRGDADRDGVLALTDAILTLGTLFLGTGELRCLNAADANDDGKVDVADAIASLSHLFLGTLEIPPPGPTVCGPDPTPSGSLSCQEYGACPG